MTPLGVYMLVYGILANYTYIVLVQFSIIIIIVQYYISYMHKIGIY